MSYLLCVLHSIEGEVNSLCSTLVRLMVSVVCIIEELTHVSLIALNIETIASEDYQSYPSPD